MHPERRTLILTVILLLLFSLLGAQTFRFSVNPTELKAGDQGKISVRMTIPEGKHQSRNPLDDEYFKLSASHPDLVFGKTISLPVTTLSGKSSGITVALSPCNCPSL